jgi:hypothetical protein
MECTIPRLWMEKSRARARERPPVLACPPPRKQRNTSTSYQRLSGNIMSAIAAPSSTRLGRKRTNTTSCRGSCKVSSVGTGTNSGLKEQTRRSPRRKAPFFQNTRLYFRTKGSPQILGLQYRMRSRMALRRAARRLRMDPEWASKLQGHFKGH